MIALEAQEKISNEFRVEPRVSPLWSISCAESAPHFHAYCQDSGFSSRCRIATTANTFPSTYFGCDCASSHVQGTLNDDSLTSDHTGVRPKLPPQVLIIQLFIIVVELFRPIPHFSLPHEVNIIVMRSKLIAVATALAVATSPTLSPMPKPSPATEIQVQEGAENDP